MRSYKGEKGSPQVSQQDDAQYSDYEQPGEDFWQDATPSMSFNGEPKITIRGMVTKQERMQQTDYDSKEPLFWPDGRPRQKLVLTMRCAEGDITLTDENNVDDAEDGYVVRMLHVRVPSGLHTAIKAAIKEAGRKTLYNGDVLTATYDHDGPQSAEDKRRKRTPPKEFEALVEPANEPPF
jgi:hypothetical protein